MALRSGAPRFLVAPVSPTAAEDRDDRDGGLDDARDTGLGTAAAADPTSRTADLGDPPAGPRVADVAVALRRRGAGDVSEVRQAVLAPGGAIVVDLAADAQDVTRAGLARYHEQLRE